MIADCLWFVNTCSQASQAGGSPMKLSTSFLQHSLNSVACVLALGFASTAMAVDLHQTSELDRGGNSGNSAMTYQQGHGNDSTVLQSGFRNDSLTAQSGVGNRVLIVQGGAGNQVRVLQSGGYLEASIAQYGHGHEANILQKGFAKEASVTQSGVQGREIGRAHV